MQCSIWVEFSRMDILPLTHQYSEVLHCKTHFFSSPVDWNHLETPANVLLGTQTFDGALWGTG